MPRHTAKWIFDRLKVERGYTMVREAVTKWKATTKEVFAPLSHPPGEAQVEFGFAYVDVAGERQQVALFVMSLPYSDAVYIQAFPRECTEAGKRHAISRPALVAIRAYQIVLMPRYS